MLPIIETLKRRRARSFKCDYKGDGLAIRGKGVPFDDERFARAWSHAEEMNREGWPDGVPDIRWRAHVCCWAAHNGLRLEGDFVECGVHTGLLSMTICGYLELTGRRFLLFDTFEGIPVERAPESERASAVAANQHYFDVYALAERNFGAFPEARLVRGILPDTLDTVDIDRIAYLSIDLNSAWAEKAVIERLWDSLSPGALVVIDDYGWRGHDSQRAMWDAFAAGKQRTILLLPTGQGMLSR